MPQLLSDALAVIIHGNQAKMYRQAKRLPWCRTRLRRDIQAWAERALRPAVIERKLSFNTQSAAGSRFIERMVTVFETCRIQQRHVFRYLACAVTAHAAGQTPPSLLPVS